MKGIYPNNQRFSTGDSMAKLEFRPLLRRKVTGVGYSTLCGRDKSVQSVQPGADIAANQISAKKAKEDEGNESFFAEEAGGEVPWGSAYEKARSLLSSLSKGVSQLETDITTRRKDLGHSTRQIESILKAAPSTEEGQALREAEERVRKLQVMVQGLQRERTGGEQRLHQLQVDYQQVYQKLKEAQKAAADAQVLREEAALWQEEKSALLEEIDAAKMREAELLSGMQTLEEGMAQRDNLLQQLQQEAVLSSSALQQAAKAMVAARDRTLRMEEQLEQTGDLLTKEQQNTSRIREQQIQLQMDLAEARQEADVTKARLEQLASEITRKDQLIESTREEATKSQKMLDMTTKSLQEARQTIESLEKRSDVDKQVLREEIEASSGVLKSAAQREQALRVAEGKVHDLSAELATLKEEMAKQERSAAAMREETIRNAQMLLAAAQTRQELESAQKQIGQLSGQVSALEEELKSRDALLMDIRNDTKNSANALQVASKYKQELNQVREREALLQEELEAKQSLLEELRKELTTNLRAQRAEQALRQVGQRNRELEEEAEALRRGSEAREEALASMQQELQQSAAMLTHAQENRQALKELQRQVEVLKSEVGWREKEKESETGEREQIPRMEEEASYHLEAAAAAQAQVMQTRGRTSNQWSRTGPRRGNNRGYPLKNPQSRGNSNTGF